MLFQIRLGAGPPSAQTCSAKRITALQRKQRFSEPTGNENTSEPSRYLRSEWLAQRSGNWNSGFNNQGSNGYYWSSTQNSATNGRNLNFNSSNVNPSNNNNKNTGLAVRCVAA